MLSSAKTISVASVFLVFLFLQETTGLAKVSIRFLNYKNPAGKGSNGHCCDGRWNVCQKNGCDHRFTVCLGDTSSERNVKNCKYGRAQSEQIKNQDSITFGSKFGGVANPMHFTVNGPLPKYMDLKVEVWDYDRFSRDDFVDFLKLRYRTAGSILNTKRPHIFIVRSRTELRVEISVRCAPNWYGDLCSTYCKPRNDDSGHYTCSAAGQKKCLPGWTGPGCKKKEPPKCTENVCLNGGTCVDTKTGFKCLCASGFYGTFCSKHRCVQSCRPGVCRYLTVKPSCVCPRGYQKGYKNPGNIPVCRRISTTTTSRPLPTSTSNPLARDCDELATKHGYKYKDGVYTIKVKNLATPFQVYCDMSSRGRTLIQQRVDGSVSFNRTWKDYKVGFGTPGIHKNYWIGLERLHYLTQQRSYKLQITMQLFNGAFRFATYNIFRVDSEASDFRLHIGGFSGNAGDALTKHNLAKFSTYDRDNDTAYSKFNCAKKYGSGWWFKSCFYANLNGIYKKSTNGWPKCRSSLGSLSLCIKWGALSSSYRGYSLKRVEMYLLPR